ncbi:TetR/AcrR family transcriptional regulator [Actinosynnema pretiosum]|uniref:TetR family transcriptional regulator n=1 Tax=Actinosynnema pretiosum TaxID=42197 RepID=A0A290Z7G4_9PSEU|nr:TetR/AcrR family transcriptional regulator [Actinosynnema pretiosum]ATE54924.1 TetR family transcriptional regulator [Actinosynnema pretiosum]
MVVYAGQGDARRSLSLLWREDAGDQARPGPKQGLTVDSIVDAAIAVADDGGMEALSMRAVGERLGRTAMALYTYVPNKAELVDLMYDRVLAELPGRYDLDDGWRPALGEWACDTRAFYLWHPWVLRVSQARPVLGPNEFASLETLVTILRETGIDRGGLRGIVGALTQFVRGSAQVTADTRGAAKATGVGDEEWWYGRAPLLDAYDLGNRFPMVVWVNEDPPPPVELSGDGPPEGDGYLEREAALSFAAGLEVLLDGIEVAAARARG